jgi:hypothetical protein
VTVWTYGRIRAPGRPRNGLRIIRPDDRRNAAPIGYLDPRVVLVRDFYAHGNHFGLIRPQSYPGTFFVLYAEGVSVGCSKAIMTADFSRYTLVVAGVVDSLTEELG